MIPADLSVGLAFIAGLVSIVSPCVLPLIPTYLTYLGGVTLADMQGPEQIRAVKRKVMVNALAFVGGFTLVFIAFGMTASALGRFLSFYAPLLRRVGGVFVIGMGLYMMGMLRVDWLDRDHRLKVNSAGDANPCKSLLLGMAFSAGWTPCIGPILAGVLMLAGSSQTLLRATLLLAVYSAGLAVPFLLLAFSFNRFVDRFRRLGPYLRTIQLVSGLLLVVIGIMLLTDTFTQLNALFNWSF